MKFNTKTIHGGQSPDKAYGAVMPPIYQTTTYAQTTPGGHQGYEYSRSHNPTRHALEKSFASIENGQFGLAFGSGLAAIDAVLKLLKPGMKLFLRMIYMAVPTDYLPRFLKNFKSNFILLVWIMPIISNP